MPAKGDQNTERKRPHPRRLFSFDSIKSAASSASRRSSSEHDSTKPSASLVNPFDLSGVQEGDDEGLGGPEYFPEKYGQAIEPVADSNSAAFHRAMSPPPLSEPRQARQRTRLEPVRPIALVPNRSSTPDIPPSGAATPTRARWENLRQHVLPPPARPQTPPQRPASAQSHHHLPARSTTPKPSRLARLGFKQVVEHAREVQVDDTRKFGEEVWRACEVGRWGTGGDLKPHGKDSSTTTLTGTMASTTTTNATAKKLDYLRRPQSLASLALTTPASSSAFNTASASAAPSLRLLHQTLHHYSEACQGIIAHLPNESHVLGTMLCPFLIPEKYGSRLEEERTIAVEAFELVSKSWTAVDESASIERSLWCTKSASTLSPSLTRTMILGSLWRLLVPGDQNRILLTAHGFQSLTNGLLLLLVALHRSSSPSPSSSYQRQHDGAKSQPTVTHPDIHLLRDLIVQFLSGSLGDLEDDHVEDLYGVEYNLEDRRNMGAVRKAVFLEAAVGLVGVMGAGGVGCILRVVEEYWPRTQSPFNDSVPVQDPTLTPLQAVICARRLNTFCRAALGILKPFTLPLPSSALPSSPTSNENPTHLSPSASASFSPSSFSFESPSSSSASLSSPLPSTPYNDNRSVPSNNHLPRLIVSLLQTRVLPEADALDSEDMMTEGMIDDKVVLGSRVKVAGVLLEVVCLVERDEGPKNKMVSPREDVFGGVGLRDGGIGGQESGGGVGVGVKASVGWGAGVLTGWYRGGGAWRSAMEQALGEVITGGWDRAVVVLSSLLKHLPEDVRKPMFMTLFPILNDHFVEDPPPHPHPRLSSFLTTLSKLYPLIFYKPLFACAASDKEFTVVNHLCTLMVHSRYVKDYWVRDFEMMGMALLGDAPTRGVGIALGGEGVEKQWGTARLGQMVLLVELIGKLQMVRHGKEAAAGNNSDGTFVEVVRFTTALETRLALLVDAKEQTTYIPPSQRTLFCILFRESRLLSRSLKPASWLSRTLSWFNTFWADDEIEYLEQEVVDSMERVQGLYMAAQEGVQQNEKRRNSMLSSAVAKTMFPDPSSRDTPQPLDLAATFVEHRKLIDSLSKGYAAKAMKLFVTMSALISTDCYQKLGPLLWEHGLDDNLDSSSTASACCLLMQCAEKAPMDLLAAIEVDLQTSDDQTRLESVRKISVLINWRFQIVTQNIITDRTHRPFKLARAPLPFLATDIGTSLYVHVEERKENKDNDDVPLELKKRLAELGWAEEDAGVVDQRQELIKIPLSLLPANQMDRSELGSNELNMNVGLSPSPNVSPQPSPRKFGIQRDQQQQQQPGEDVASALLRRNSTSGGPTSGVRRRAVFVPPLTLIFRRLATLVFDPNFAVASAARNTILDLMRNDPALLTRPMFDLFAGEHKNIESAISTLTAFMHIRKVLPPPLTHHIFNNLAGFLKLGARHLDLPETLYDFGRTAPILATLATQVSGMSIREIRRAKIEHFIIPSGSLWFPATAPKGPMFPRNLGTSNNPFEPVPPKLISVTMVRVSQNMLFLSLLKRNYQDVQVIRKNMARLVLPSLDDDASARVLEVQDFMPRVHVPDTRPSLRDGTVEVLSLMLSRSYVLLVAQIFRSMSRHLSDRHELAVLIDGLNRILLAHGDDINIVSQVLIALMVASTRFRRLFTSGGGYTLFMPSIIKVYTETPSHPGIRLAIEYAMNRFYALHKETFLFQSIDTIGQIAMLPDVDPEWFSAGVYNLFFSLRKGNNSSTVDVAGIRNANKSQEREALIIRTADEKPQTFLAAMRRVESQTGLQMSVVLPDEYESNRLSMDDFVRLFLTVIAHDPTISRAQHFLRLLRYLAPHLYNSSASTRAILVEGIAALGQILPKAFAKPKGENSSRNVAREEDTAFLSSDPGLETSSTEKSRIPSDNKSMRLDYLHLVLSFGLAGGQVSLSIAHQTLEIVKNLLKDWTDSTFDVLALFLSDFVKMLLIREDAPMPKFVVAFLHDLSPILHAYMVAVDFTGVFETILKLSEMSLYANDASFSEVVVGEVCTAGLAACELAASENHLMTLQYRPALISLLGEAIFLKDVDVIAELEKRPPTHLFLAGVVLPLTMSMNTESQVIAHGLRTDDHRKALRSAWVRLLYYAMAACQKSRRDEESIQRSIHGLGGSFRSKSSRKGNSEGPFWKSHLPTFMTALQVIKVIVIRGAPDISLPRLGIWERLAVFLRTMLSEGSANFAFRTEINSAVTTPSGSPRTSSQFDLSTSGSNLFLSTSDLGRPNSPFSHSNPPSYYARPRMVDYSLWSMLEFICAYRNPLRMQLKLLTMEKVLSLDQELQHQEIKNIALSPFATSPSSRRVSTSIFSKPRKHTSGLMIPSPDSSPRLSPSTSTLLPSLSMPTTLEIPTSRRAGYLISPVTPHDRHPGLPKIVHLGPTSPSAFPPISSPMIGAGLAGVMGRPVSGLTVGSGSGMEGEGPIAKATRIKSLMLIQETYRRIRGVQAFLGYSLLLPLPGSSGSALQSSIDEDAALETWTRQQALEAIAKETKELLEEFEQSFGLDEDSVMVEVESPSVAVTYSTN
ncbi:hypothetical protein B0H34DRAFT_751522 [Crassisporium funariophilum]|nr:hypothetical protein B0H34DRAFT_751522 [Crassisporium funariophilum]